MLPVCRDDGFTVSRRRPAATELDDAEGFWGFFAVEWWEPGLPADVGIVREIRTVQVSLGLAPWALRETVFGCNLRPRRDGYETVGQSDRVVCWRLRRIGAVWSWRLTRLARQWSWRGAWRAEIGPAGIGGIGRGFMTRLLRVVISYSETLCRFDSDFR